MQKYIKIYMTIYNEIILFTINNYKQNKQRND